MAPMDQPGLRRVIDDAWAERQQLSPIESSLSMTAPETRLEGRIVDIRCGLLQVRLAETAADIDAAQALRYRIFYDRLGAQPLPEMASRQRDTDRFDEECDHLLVLDHGRGRGDSRSRHLPLDPAGNGRAPGRVLFGRRIRYRPSDRASRRDS